MDNYLMYFYELNKEKFEMFKTQDPSIADFDVVFQFGEQKLYAHKSKLTDVSTTFTSMLSERWTSPNQPIKIESFPFVYFKEFTTFIYSGCCNLTHDNIASMVDMAEFYNVKIFKKACENFLSKTVWNVENAYQMLKLAYKYSMDDLKKSLLAFVSVNLLIFIKSEHFQTLEKPMIYDIVESNKNIVRQEELFEMVYKWAEKLQVFKWAEDRMLKMQTFNEDLNLNEFIKEELSSVLPLFKFHLMNQNFLIEFVVKKSFLFSGTQLSNILSGARYLVVLVDENGKMMKGVLNCPDIDKVYRIVQCLRYTSTNICYRSFMRKEWDMEHRIDFEKSSKLIKNQNWEWYLVYYSSYEYSHYSMQELHVHKMAVKHRNKVEKSDYLLAELIAEDGFQLKSSSFV